MRIAVLADIHGNVAALEAVRADLARRGVDRVVNLGDCVSGPLWPAETAALLRSLDWPTVRGNHDRWVAEWSPERLGATDRFTRGRLNDAECAWLKALPPTVDLGAGTLAVHGTPDDDNAYLLETVEGGRLVDAGEPAVRARLGRAGLRLVLCAHSHRPGLLRLADGALVVNPGSVGCPAYTDPTDPPHCSEARSPHARYAIVLDEADGFAVEHVAIRYDWEAAAVAAETNGRPDWAAALRTGFVEPA